MTPPNRTDSVQSVYNFWLGLIPQFLGQFGGGVPGAASAAGKPPMSVPLSGLSFPADQVARAATMTQEALQALSQAYAPMLQLAGAPGLLGQWAAMMPTLFGASAQAASAATASTAQAMFAPWTAMMPNFAGAAAVATPVGAATTRPVLPFQQMTQAWQDLGSRFVGGPSQDLTTAFDRTYGAVSDALGFGPVRQLNAAWQDAIAASFAQQEARASYALLVQEAFAKGLERLLTRLAEKADAGERIDSILALLRLWAMATEETVQETLQSEHGLTATAALTRAALAQRKKMQRVAGIIADLLDMATRRDLDEAFREIQSLKRELRALRAPTVPAKAIDKPPRARKRRST